MRRKKIAIDCRALTANMSGVGRYVLNLAQEISKSDQYEIFLLTRKDFHPSLTRLNGAKIIQLPMKAQSVHYIDRFIWEQRFLRGLLESLKLDAYHATWNYGIPLLPTCPTVLTLHDLLPMELPNEFGSRSWRYAYIASQFIALRRATKIIAVSQSTKSDILKHARFAVDKTTVILEGVEPEFRPSPPSKSLPSYILYVGGYGERKNLGNLLKSYQLAVMTMGVTQPLKMTGSPEKFLTEDLKIFNELNPIVREKIKFIGFVDDSELPALYQSASMLVFPSLGEGFGFPPLEAIACGTPVITTRCGSIPEVVGDAAFFVNGLDPNSIAQGIAEIQQNVSLRAKLIGIGLQRAQILSWKACADATMDLYQKIFDEKR